MNWVAVAISAPTALLAVNDAGVLGALCIFVLAYIAIWFVAEKVLGKK